MNRILDKYITIYYKTGDYTKNRINDLRTILLINKRNNGIVTDKMIYRLWDEYTKIAYNIYVTEYFGKPVNQNSYRGVVKLADILIRYTVDGLLHD